MNTTTTATDAVDAPLWRTFEDAPAVIAIHRGPEHRFVFANRLFRESGDGRPIVGRAYAEAFPEFVEQGYLDIFNRVFSTGEPFVATGARADTPRVAGGPPEERYWNVTFQATRGPDGTIDGVSSFAFEVTEHVRARRIAEAAERRYDELVDNLGVVVFCIDPQGWEPRWVRGHVLAVLGLPPEEATRPGVWWEDLHPDDHAAVQAARASLALEGDRYRVEYRRGGGARGWRWIAESGQLRGEHGSTQLLAWGLAQDVTERISSQNERERLQTQLLHVQKLESLGVLAGGIAHDFNNLLTAILGNASLAEMQLTPGHPATRPVGAMVSAARRASDLTRQLLAFSGRGHFRVETVDLNRQLRELVALLEATIPKKVTLRLEPAPALPHIECDVAQLTQVLMNLVINGAEAIGEDAGTVLVRTGVQELAECDVQLSGQFGEGAAGRYVFIEVSDTGQGMDDGTLSRIFDPFFTTKPTGRGLGLSAVQGIVRGHKGLVRVYSEVGRGTTFKVLLPTAEGLAHQGSASEAATTATPSGTVLVVDDESSVRGIARAALTYGGYRVIEACDGHEGVETFRALAGEIDVVLLDLTMPRMNGEEALRAIRKVREAVPVILSSGYNEVDATRRLVGRGRVDFLQKPYTVKELLDAIAKALVD